LIQIHRWLEPTDGLLIQESELCQISKAWRFQWDSPKKPTKPARQFVPPATSAADMKASGVVKLTKLAAEGKARIGKCSAISLSPS
jgi:hypothetical protein